MFNCYYGFLLKAHRTQPVMIPFSRPVNWLYLDGSCHELGHTWHPSCLYCTAELFAIVFWSAVKVYLPLYLVIN